MDRDQQPSRKTHPTVDEPAGRAEPVASHTVMFWFLLLLAFAVFAPCVLLPTWIRYAKVYRQEQVMQARVEAMKSTQARQDRTIEALRTDPAVNERVALRELRYRRPGETMAAVTTQAQTWESLDVVEPIRIDVAVQSPEPPWFVSRLDRHLPDLPLRAVFCESPSREVSIAMSIALMAMAFWLYSPRKPAGRSRPKT